MTKAPIETLLEQTYAHRRNENFVAARSCVQDALAQARRGDDPELLARTLMAAGQIERDEGWPNAAAQPYDEAVSIFRQTGDNAGLAHAIRHLGDLETERKRYPAAEAAYREALSLYETLDAVAPLTLANALRAFAVLNDRTSKPDEANKLWSRAKTLYEKSGVQEGVDECAARLAL